MLRSVTMLQLFLLSSCLICAISGSTPARSSSEIIEKLLLKYDKTQSPKRNETTVTEAGMYVMGLNFKDAAPTSLQMVMYLRVQWRDPRLAFTPANGEPSSIILPESAWDKLWTPDVFIRGSIDSKLHDVLTPNRLFKLWSDGRVRQSSKLTVETLCQLNFRQFPHDTQTCGVALESYSHTMDTMVIEPLEKPASYDAAIDLPDFSVEEAVTSDCSEKDATGAYPCLTMQFTFKRKIGYFAIQVFLPSIFLVIVSWISFWINHEAPVPRLATGLLTLIALAVIGGQGRQSMSRVTSATSLDCWMLGCYSFVFASLLEYALVSVLLKSRQQRGGFKLLLPASLEHKNAEQLIVDKTDGASEVTVVGDRVATWLDWLSRILFPIAFVIFNMIYWIANLG